MLLVRSSTDLAPREMVSFLLVKVCNEVEPKAEHHDESAAQKTMDEQRTALTTGAQDPRFLVEDESCHTPRADRGGVFPLSRDQQSVRVSSEPFSNNCRGCALLSPSTDGHRRQSPCDGTQPHGSFGTYFCWRMGRCSSTNIVRSAWKATSTV